MIDGCWELLLNGTCDWTYRLINLLTTLECALNGGALLSANPVTLRGEKISYKTPLPADDPSIDLAGLKEMMKQHIKFFTDQSALSIYKLYLIDQAINPTPLYSSLLKGCMENGRDKTWGGSDYRLGGVVAAGAPDAANTLAAIKKWVFKRRSSSLRMWSMQCDIVMTPVVMKRNKNSTIESWSVSSRIPPNSGIMRKMWTTS